MWESAPGKTVPVAKNKTEDPLMTTHQVAELLGAEPSSVIRWFDKGILKGWRTPGGHRRIRASSVVAYLVAKGMEIPDALQRVPAPADVQPAGPRARRLLWIDRDASFLLGVGRSLAPLDDEVEPLLLDDPVEALLEVPRFDPQVVVYDLGLDGASGLAVCRALARRGRARVILVADAIDGELRRAADAAGAVGVFTRPLAVAEVLRHLGLPAPGGARSYPEVHLSP